MVYDRENKSVNLGKKKATDMDCNQRVNLLDPFENDTETKRNNLKIELMKTYDKYIGEKCDKRGNIKDSVDITI